MIARSLINMQNGSMYLNRNQDDEIVLSIKLPVFTESNGLITFIHDRLSADEKRNNPLTLSLIKLVPGAGDIMVDRGAVIDSELYKLKEKALEIFRKKNDEVLVLESENMLALLTDASEESARVVVNRVLQAGLKQSSVVNEALTSTVVITPDIDPGDWFAIANSRLVKADLSKTAQKVLIIDDDKNLLKTIRIGLKSSRLKINVDATSNGYDGCLKVGYWNPDIILLDIMMPGFDGVKVLKKIKSYDTFQSKVLIMSAERNEIENVMKIGADDYIIKPFDLQDLIEKVEELMDQAVTVV